MPRLSAVQRAQIIGQLNAPGETAATVARRYGVAKSTANRLRQKSIACVESLNRQTASMICYGPSDRASQHQGKTD